eukprot:7375886-Prymnesium_polylepis.1
MSIPMSIHESNAALERSSCRKPLEYVSESCVEAVSLTSRLLASTEGTVHATETGGSRDAFTTESSAFVEAREPKVALIVAVPGERPCMRVLLLDDRNTTVGAELVKRL